MALKLSGLFQTNVSDMYRGEQVSQTHTRNEGSSQTQTEAQAKELTPGQAIRGEIVGKNGQEIQIRIAKDVILNARMEQDIQASAGQRVTFEVRSNVSGVISLRPLFQNMSQENNALKALVQAGIESDAKNMQMVSTMMQEGMSIGKEALQGMYKGLVDISEADVPNAVQMNRLQIPVTPENLQQFEAYKNYEHQLLSSFSQVAEEIPQAVSQLFSEGRLQEGTVLIDRLLTVFDTDAGNAEGPLIQSTMNVDIQGTAETGTINNPLLSESGLATTGDLTAGGALAEGDIIQEGETLADTKALPSDKLTVEEQALPEENVLEKGQVEAAGAKGFATEALLTTGVREQLVAVAKEAGASAETVSRLQGGQMEKEDIYQLVRTLAETADTPEKQSAVKELFVSEGFQKIFQEKIGSQWLLRVPEHLEKEEVSKLYERLNEQTKQLTQALSEAVKADSPLFKSVQSIRENVDFMNQLNQIYTYVQLPLKWNQNRAHGDLYVYTNKRNLAKKDGNISAFLHLDMEHLGMVDVYVAMEQGKISTNFYLEDEESLALLEKNMNLLTKRLTEKGYQAEAKLMLRDQPGNAMEEILATDKNISIISEQSFDVRA